MDWVKYHPGDEPIPKELYYDGYQTDKGYNSRTPLMNWIAFHSSDPIPQELFYDGCQTDRDNCGKTPLMYWNDYREG